MNARIITNAGPHSGRVLPPLLLTATLLLLSMPAHTAVHGVAGEALLVPFVVSDPAHGMNTTIRITIPDRVASGRIPNELTAPHTTPGSEGLANFVPLETHWSFFDDEGMLRLNFKQAVPPNGVLSLDWGARSGSYLQGMPGYLVIQSEAGYAGGSSAFNMFGDATMTFPGGTATIPVFAMADGEDAAKGADERPSLSNQVVRWLPGPALLAAPLASGIETGRVGDSPETETSFDLTFGRRKAVLYGGISPVKPWPFVPAAIALPKQSTLLVIWNDRNNPAWKAVPVFVYDDRPWYCSAVLPLGKVLNLFWAQPPGAPATGPNPSYIQNATLCSPSSSSLHSSGYVRIWLPSPQEDAASAAFSIIFSSHPITVPAHERGRFDPALD